MRLPQLFKTGELPENQNIYFWCEKIPQFNLLISPGLLIPCAVAGIMVLLLTGAWKKRYGLLLIPIVTLALPLCAREVIGRYRLMLTPYFTVICVCGFYELKKITAPKRNILLIAALVAGGMTFFIHTDLKKIRPEDHHAWAEALIRTPGTEKKEILEAYRQGKKEHF